MLKTDAGGGIHENGKRINHDTVGERRRNPRSASDSDTDRAYQGQPVELAGEKARQGDQRRRREARRRFVRRRGNSPFRVRGAENNRLPNAYSSLRRRIALRHKTQQGALRTDPPGRGYLRDVLRRSSRFPKQRRVGGYPTSQGTVSRLHGAQFLPATARKIRI